MLTTRRAACKYLQVEMTLGWRTLGLWLAWLDKSELVVVPVLEALRTARRSRRPLGLITKPTPYLLDGDVLRFRHWPLNYSFAAGSQINTFPEPEYPMPRMKLIRLPTSNAENGSGKRAKQRM